MVRRWAGMKDGMGLPPVLSYMVLPVYPMTKGAIKEMAIKLLFLVFG